MRQGLQVSPFNAACCAQCLAKLQPQLLIWWVSFVGVHAVRPSAGLACCFSNSAYAWMGAYVRAWSWLAEQVLAVPCSGCLSRVR